MYRAASSTQLLETPPSQREVLQTGLHTAGTATMYPTGQILSSYTRGAGLVSVPACFRLTSLAGETRAGPLCLVSTYLVGQAYPIHVHSQAWLDRACPPFTLVLGSIGHAPIYSRAWIDRACPHLLSCLSTPM